MTFKLDTSGITKAQLFLYVDNIPVDVAFIPYGDSFESKVNEAKTQLTARYNHQVEEWQTAKRIAAKFNLAK